jgi:hypothetical protein
MKTWIKWTGRLITVLPVLTLVWSAHAKLTHDPFYVKSWEQIGYDPAALTRIGFVQITCLVLYLIPQTSVFGAILLTGYLGGAVSSWVRIGQPYPMMVPLTTCVLAWVGLYLREERLWALVPFRRRHTS